MKVFQVWPTRSICANGITLTPAMMVVVPLKYHAPSPFSNGMDAVAEVYWRIFRCDIKKMGCNSGNFKYKALG